MDDGFASRQKVSKRQEDLGVVVVAAASQRPRVDLVVAGLDLLVIFHQEAESNEAPPGILPLGSNREGDGRLRGCCLVIRDRLDVEIQVFRVFGFQIVHRYGDVQLAVELVRQGVLVALGLLAL